MVSASLLTDAQINQLTNQGVESFTDAELNRIATGMFFAVKTFESRLKGRLVRK